MKEHWKPSKALQSLPLQPFTICSSLRRRDSHPIAAALLTLKRKSFFTKKYKYTFVHCTQGNYNISTKWALWDPLTQSSSTTRFPPCQWPISLWANGEGRKKAEKTYRELRHATLVNSDWVPELIVRALCLAKTFKSFSYN